jgi:hypothetical protein
VLLEVDASGLVYFLIFLVGDTNCVTQISVVGSGCFRNGFFFMFIVGDTKCPEHREVLLEVDAPGMVSFLMI